MMLVGLVFGLIFVLWESRYPEPIVPLKLFRNRTFTISVIAMSLAAFGFFGAVVFLPRWFQTVGGASATESGYSLLPLLAALIVSATLSGQIVARTSRYKLLIFGSLVTLAIGLFLLTNLHAATERWVMWIWMVVAGLGIGPSFAVFGLIVQNAVRPQEVGAASSSLTFFQQIGGTVGLTIATTLFASRLIEELPGQLRAAGVPEVAIQGFEQGGGQGFDLTGTDLRQTILDAFPQAAPIIDAIIAGIHEAFSIAVASTFWIGIAGAVLAAIAVLFLKEIPMRTTWEMPPEAVEEKESADRPQVGTAGEGAPA
jgi:predicted MFS family arabinose efflux permease